MLKSWLYAIFHPSHVSRLERDILRLQSEVFNLRWLRAANDSTITKLRRQSARHEATAEEYAARLTELAEANMTWPVEK